MIYSDFYRGTRSVGFSNGSPCLSLAPPTKNQRFPIGRPKALHESTVKASGKPRRWVFRRCDPLSLTVTSLTGAEKTWNIDLAKTRSNTLVIYGYRWAFDKIYFWDIPGIEKSLYVAHISPTWIFGWIRGFLLLFTTFCRKSVLWLWHFVSHLYGWDGTGMGIKNSTNLCAIVYLDRQILYEWLHFIHLNNSPKLFFFKCICREDPIFLWTWRWWQPPGTMARKTSSAVLQGFCVVMNPKASTAKKNTNRENWWFCAWTFVVYRSTNPPGPRIQSSQKTVGLCVVRDLPWSGKNGNHVILVVTGIHPHPLGWFEG